MHQIQSLVDDKKSVDQIGYLVAKSSLQTSNHAVSLFFLIADYFFLSSTCVLSNRKKHTPKHGRQYDEGTIHEAVAEIQAKRLSIYQAARLYKIPRRTLSSHAKNAAQSPKTPDTPESEKSTRLKNYNKSDITKAMAEIRENGVSASYAARLYKIPQTTFSQYVRNAGLASTRSKSRKTDRTKHTRSKYVNVKAQPKVKHLTFREAANLYKISLLESVTNTDGTSQWSIKVRMTYRIRFEKFKP